MPPLFFRTDKSDRVSFPRINKLAPFQHGTQFVCSSCPTWFRAVLANPIYADAAAAAAAVYSVYVYTRLQAV